MARILIIAYRFFDHDPRLRGHTEAFLRRGDSVDVICLTAGENRTDTKATVIGLPQVKYRGASRTLYYLHYLRFFSTAALIAMQRSIRQPYDLVLAISMPDAAVFCALVTRPFGSKIVLDITDPMPELFCARFGGRLGGFGTRLLMLQEQLSARFADQVFAVHGIHRSRLETAGVDSAKLTIVMNSPDPAIFKPHPQNERCHGSFILLFHGSVLARQGIDTAITAVSIVRKRIPHIKLRVVGFGDYLGSARQLTERLGVTGEVSFCDPVSLERVPELLAEADVGLVPLHANDATHLMLPVKLLEYATFGIPVIAARLKAIQHHFCESALRFFEPGDAHDLARAIEDLHDHPEVRARLVEEGLRVVKAFSWDIQRVQFDNAVDALLGLPPDLVASQGTQPPEPCP